jgi:putative restriction endonuclease
LGLRDYVPTTQNVDLTEDDLEFPEGKKKFRNHILRERNPTLVLKAKKRFKEQHGSLFCEVCNFKFVDKYGELGLDFIEAHHIKPVSTLEENERTRVEDLVMVCSNCHKMLHRKRPWISKDDLQEIIRNR